MRALCCEPNLGLATKGGHDDKGNGLGMRLMHPLIQNTSVTNCKGLCLNVPKWISTLGSEEFKILDQQLEDQTLSKLSPL